MEGDYKCHATVQKFAFINIKIYKTTQNHFKLSIKTKKKGCNISQTS